MTELFLLKKILENSQKPIDYVHSLLYNIIVQRERTKTKEGNGNDDERIY